MLEPFADPGEVDFMQTPFRGTLEKSDAIAKIKEEEKNCLSRRLGSSRRILFAIAVFVPRTSTPAMIVVFDASKKRTVLDVVCLAVASTTLPMALRQIDLCVLTIECTRFVSLLPSSFLPSFWEGCYDQHTLGHDPIYLLLSTWPHVSKPWTLSSAGTSYTV